ncbi:MAG TPA: DUF4166 domain-containing protein [Rhizobiaceae bacterium]|nr:DUF4166 domain-containing protein [Rhizobiaceae bacterium]
MAKVLVLGGYGVFGGKLARRLAAEPGIEVLVAGRSLEKAQAFCHAHGGAPVALDRDGDLSAALNEVQPDIVVDAAGPFQNYGGDPYRVAQAAVAAGVHYVDLADDAAFVAGIGALDAAAKAAGVSVISGASSVPAISGAALDELTRGLTDIALVESIILPGNRAPRGLSVMQAIVGQVGKPLKVWRGGKWTSPLAWGDVKTVDLTVPETKPVPGRLASRIGAPDLLLFPARYKARSVEFRAGLDLKLLHLGLWALGWLVRARLLQSLHSLVPTMKWIADRLEFSGSDRGGMLVRAIGRREGETVERNWTLIAEAGDGPEVPPTPAYLVCRRLIGEAVPAYGAYPCLGMLTLAEIEQDLSPFSIRFARNEVPAQPLLEQAVGPDAASMPGAWHRLADVHDQDRFAGEASVERGSSFLSRLAGALFRFPAATERTSVEVIKEKTRAGETWTRRFGESAFVSHLSRRASDGPGILRERFGPLLFIMRLRVRDSRVEWPVERWRFLGLPMPAALRPNSETSEFIDGEGRFNFDVAISVPLAGKIVRYRGWLEPSSDGSAEQ